MDDIPEELEDEAESAVASIRREREVDNPVEGSSSPSAAPTPNQSLQPTTDELKAICHAFVEQLRNGTAPWVVQRLNNTYGPMPDDTSNFTFWMAQVCL